MDDEQVLAFQQETSARGVSVQVFGLSDDNAGTSPLQSTQLYSAIRGNGGTSELLLLPWEGHTYRARESVFSAAAQMLEWFDKHVKMRADSAEQKRTGALQRPSE